VIDIFIWGICSANYLFQTLASLDIICKLLLSTALVRNKSQHNFEVQGTIFYTRKIASEFALGPSGTHQADTLVYR